jgi:hypothetical protein
MRLNPFKRPSELRSRLVRMMVLGAMALMPLATLPPQLSAAEPKQQTKEELAIRQKWENIVQFYGEEESNQFSLRILDRDAKEEGQFLFKEIWNYDREKKEWVKMNAPERAVKVVPASQKPKLSPPDSQVLTDLPISIQQVGLYYAKWTIDGIACSTYIRLGPRARDRKDPGKAPPGHMKDDVPLNTDNAEIQIIPDPRYHTGEGSLPLPKK